MATTTDKDPTTSSADPKAADPKLPKVKKTIEIADGDGVTRTLTILRGRGKHQLNAQRAAGRDRDMIPVLLVHQLVLLDGERLTAEDWLEDVDLDVFLEAQAQVLGGDVGKEVTPADS